MFVKFNYNVMRLWVFFLVGFFLLGLVNSVSSNTNSVFNIAGCNFDFNGVPIGVSSGECSGGVASGYFFCGTDLTPYDTLVASHGCSMGSDTYTLGNDFCCPSGTFCNQTVEDNSNPNNNKFKCDVRLENCADQGTEGDCNSNGCIWMNLTNECTENPRSYDCSYYDNSADCLTDIWSIGTLGVGTEFCGSTIECNGEQFSVPGDSCGCAWYPSAPEGDRCQLKMDATQFIFSGVPDAFECSNTYNLGNCSEGTQNVSWISNSSVISGFTSTGGVIPEDCLNALDCNGGEATRFCGEPAIKLPGISFFSLMASFLIIGIYYFVVGRFKYNKGYNLL